MRTAAHCHTAVLYSVQLCVQLYSCTHYSCTAMPPNSPSPPRAKPRLTDGLRVPGWYTDPCSSHTHPSRISTKVGLPALVGLRTRWISNAVDFEYLSRIRNYYTKYKKYFKKRTANLFHYGFCIHFFLLSQLAEQRTPSPPVASQCAKISSGLEVVMMAVVVVEVLGLLVSMKIDCVW